MKEHYYDNLLCINTRSHKSENNHSIQYHPYEPTPYSALEELFKYYEVRSSDNIVDFGCGKGRLNFFLNYSFSIDCTGIEMNEKFYQEAIQNLQSYSKKIKKSGNIQFYNCYAESYEIQPVNNRFYFFNPFLVHVFRRVINNILLSLEKTPRDIELILYYASDDYRYFLEKETSFQLTKEIVIPQLVEKDPYERFLIYRYS